MLILIYRWDSCDSAYFTANFPKKLRPDFREIINVTPNHCYSITEIAQLYSCGIQISNSE